jgi:dihydrofolate synthase/folylpolyglutamate synthase
MANSVAILGRLSLLYPKIIDLSLDRVRDLMARLGDPQDHLPPVIHVAGTNGKGSTVAMLRAILEAAGYRVHAYTSPHLVRFNERIRLAGTLIQEPALVDLLEEIERVNAGAPITFFEITTAAAFLAFARNPADVVLLETGLGGRLDATNLVKAPAACVITPVSMDHMSYLGDTVAAIAGEKAGILKPGRPAVIGPQVPEALAVIEARAAAIGAPLFRAGSDWGAIPTAAGWRFEGARMSLDLPLPNLPGRHQIDNAGGVLACLERLGDLSVPQSAIRTGLAKIEWPARLQRLKTGPLVEGLGAGIELWLDGGHNPSAGAALAVQAATWSDRPLHLVVGMLNNREPADFLGPLAPHLATLQAVEIPGEPNGHDPEIVAAAARGLGIPTEIAPSVAAAIARIEGPARILICGSLYLAGSVLAENG